MGELETAALRLVLVTLAFLAVVFAVWWLRRPRPEHAAPKMPRMAGESRLPHFVRRDRSPEIEDVEIAPSRLARISARPHEIMPSYDEVYPLEAPIQPESKLAPDRVDAPVSDDEAFADEDWAPAEIVEPAEPASPLAPHFAAPVQDRLESMTPDVEPRVQQADEPETAADPIVVRLVPQIPPRDAILTHSWLGGRPKLPAAMDWPLVDGREGDFLAQIACGDFPPELWDGLGPRTGWLAFFANPDSGTPIAIHLAEEGLPRDPPHAPGAAWSGPQDGLAQFAIHAFPEWPIDIVTVRPGDADPLDEAVTADAVLDLYAAGYDIADPAFHPFDWDSMLAMAAVLESRLDRLPIDGIAPADANDELTQAIAEAAEANREAHIRAQEIITVIRESAGQGSFQPADATAVMAALHAIRWNEVVTSTDEESGEDQVETMTLPLTRHHPRADLWVHDYLSVLADRAKHAWCANPDRLSGPARALFEPQWQAQAAREMASIGGRPNGHAVGFDPELETLLIDLPASELMSRGLTDGGGLVVAIRKADIAAGDFSKTRLLRDLIG